MPPSPPTTMDRHGVADVSVASRLRVCHIISGTGVGGAQAMLHKLISRLDPTEFDNCVISLGDCGRVGQAIRELGVPVVALHALDRKRPKPWRFVKLVRLLAACRPHVVQTWMYYSDVVGGLAAKLAGRLPVVWNIRHSSLDAATDALRVRVAARMAGLLSHRMPHSVVMNSNAAVIAHQRAGYAAQKLVVIPNGFDLTEFRPSGDARRDVRRELGIDQSAHLVGLVGRYHPHKDVPTFVDAISQIARTRTDAHFVLCGRGLDWQNEELAATIQNIGPPDRFHLLGPRGDVARLHASFDVVVSSSLSEGFANVIGEAMASGVPCIVTDVGDSSDIVGTTGRVVPAQDSRAIADAVVDLLNLPAAQRTALGQAARERIAANYEIGHIVKRYEQLWRAVAANQPCNSIMRPDEFKRAA